LAPEDAAQIRAARGQGHIKPELRTGPWAGTGRRPRAEDQQWSAAASSSCSQWEVGAAAEWHCGQWEVGAAAEWHESGWRPEPDDMTLAETKEDTLDWSGVRLTSEEEKQTITGLALNVRLQTLCPRTVGQRVQAIAWGRGRG
jgi:hypothetical protein